MLRGTPMRRSGPRRRSGARRRPTCRCGCPCGPRCRPTCRCGRTPRPRCRPGFVFRAWPAVRYRDRGQPPAQLRAARRRAGMVVLGPGGRPLRVRRARLGVRPEGAQPPGGVRLFPQHQLQPLQQLLPPARASVVCDRAGPVQLGRTHRLTLRERGAPHGRQVREERLHDVPGRYLGTCQTGPHPVRIPPAEDPVPPPPGIEKRRHIPQIACELTYGHRMLMHRHRRPRPPSSGTVQSAGIRPQPCYGTTTCSFRPGSGRRTRATASAPAASGPGLRR